LFAILNRLTLSKKAISSFFDLKVLSCRMDEMDSAECRFIRQVFFEERVAEVLEKSDRAPSCESPLKISHHLVQLLAIRILITNMMYKVA
jgi:hypothetical protein